MLHLTQLLYNLPLIIRDTSLLVSQYQKGKTIWILLKQEAVWQWHQLDHMQVCTSLKTDNHNNTPPLCFFKAGCPSCRPTNSVKALKAQYM